MTGTQDRRPIWPPVCCFRLGERRRPVQIKLFDKKLVDLAHLEAEINHWLAANPKLVTIQRDFHVYHNHTTREESVLVAMWYEPKSGV
jgi:hypothetical protein